MMLSNHDENLATAEVELSRATELHRKARNELDALQAKLHSAPAFNERLAERAAQAELDGEPLPTDKPIDVDRLKRQVEALKKRVSVSIPALSTLPAFSLTPVLRGPRHIARLTPNMLARSFPRR